jgi:TPR repeat protein
MLKKILLTIAMAVPLAFACAQDSEDVKTRPNKQEITDMMVKTGRMSAQQQTGKMDAIDLSASKTPRSDFMFCTGLAFLGNYKAQKCLGEAYENGRGIVEDLSEAYAWYAIAAENQTPAKDIQEKLQAEKDRIENKLLAAYPHPTEDDLADMIKAQKARIEQYQSDVKRSPKK